MEHSCRRARIRTSLRAPRRAFIECQTPSTIAPSISAGSRAAVVTTVKDFRHLADSWVSYHLAIGFVHLYIYFDDPDELSSINPGSRFSAAQLTCVPHDAKLRREWAKLKRIEPRTLKLAESEVQTRQQLNARHAIGLALARGNIDWLLHIDADELFYPGSKIDAATHFGGLNQAGVATFCYQNHEAVPERHGIIDPFKEVSLFKRSLELVKHTQEAQIAVDFWQCRQDGMFFYYYDNGKAAVRVSEDARPLSVHEWLPGSAEGMEAWYSNMATPWAGRGELGGIVKYMKSEAAILHYPCYNVDALWIRWKRGNDNYRLGGREDPPPLHAMVCRAANAAHAQGGEAAARKVVTKLFEEQVMLTDQGELERQQRSGVCERIRAPMRLLGGSVKK